MTDETRPGEITATDLAQELGVSTLTVARAIDTIAGLNGFPQDDVDYAGTTIYLGANAAQLVRDWLAKHGNAMPALERVREAHLAYIQAEVNRAAAAEEARKVPGVTIESIASEMQMTRDGVYKLLARHGYR